MKGIIFNLLEEIVTEEHGPDTWDDLLEAAGLDGSYTSLGSYPDEDLGKLVGAASTALALPPHDVVRWVGRRALPRFHGRYPALFEPYTTTRAFALRLNDIIHPEVRKLYPGAGVPEFAFDTSSSEVLVMEYGSARRMCAFAEGLLLGTGDHYGEDVRLAQPQCMNRGDQRCLIEMSIAA